MMLKAWVGAVQGPTGQAEVEGALPLPISEGGCCPSVEG